MTQRLLYPDICKFIAIFLVTWSHCAQCISKQTWPDFLFGNSIDIAFNMPLFMIISGWFINLERLRDTKVTTYLKKKIKRLIFPALVWFLINILFINNRFDLSGFRIVWFIKAMFNYYWYLTALFFCLTIIFFTAKIIKSNKAALIFSTIIVTFCPFLEFANINFMFPFIWAGYILRIFVDRFSVKRYLLPSIVICLVLIYYWDSSSTIYLSPLIPMHISFPMFLTHLYRFLIGFLISFVIISFVKNYENTKISYLAPLGKYSLVIYVASITFLKIISLMLSKTDYYCNQPIILEIISVSLCVLITISAISIYKVCRKSKLSKTLFLGE